MPVAEGLELGAREGLLWLIGSGTVTGGIAAYPKRNDMTDLIWHGQLVAKP